MATDKLDQLFGVEEIKAQQAQVLGIIDDTVNRIAEASKKMRINELFVSDSGGLSKSVDAIKAATAAINEQKEATDKLLAAKKQEQDLANAAAGAGNAKLRKEDADVIQAITQAMAALNKEKERMAASAAQEAANAQKLSSSYDQLKKQYNDNADGAKKLVAAQVLAGNTVGDYNDKTKVAITNTQAVGEKLSAAEKSVNSYQAKVNSCNAVGTQFNTLLGQLPKLAENPQSFIEGLTENIGGFVEETLKAKEGGASWGSILSSIGTSMLGLPGLISLAVTAIGIFAGEMDKSKDVLEEYKKIQDEATEALKKYQEQLTGAADNSEKIRNISGADSLNRELTLLRSKGVALDIIYKKEQQIRQAELDNINVRYETIRYADPNKADDLIKQRRDIEIEIEAAKNIFERTSKEDAKNDNNYSKPSNKKLPKSDIESLTPAASHLLPVEKEELKLSVDAVEVANRAKQKSDEEYATWKAGQLKKSREKELQELDIIIRAAQEAFNIIANIHSANSEKKNADLDAENKKIEENRDTQIKALDGVALTEEEKTTRIAIINAQASAQEARVQQEKRKQAQKDVAFEREAALAKALFNLYLGVAKEVGGKGVIGIATATAIFAFIGSVVSAIASVKTPQYAKGTDHHPGGPFIAGDGGEQELIIPAGRRPYLSKDTPALYNEGAGTKVIPLHKLDVTGNDYMTNGLPLLPHAIDGTIISAIRGLGQQIQHASSKPYSSTKVIIDNEGIRQVYQQGAYTLRRIENKISK